MDVLRSDGFNYRGTHVCLFETPDGWHFDIHPVTQGEYPNRTSATVAAKQYLIDRDRDLRNRGRFPTVAERGVW